MALGNRVPTDVDDAGRVTTRMVPREEVLRGLDDELDADRPVESKRAHFRLSPNFGVNNPLRVEADRPIELDAGFLFEKYEVTVRDAVEVWIAFDEPASRDYYDDVLIEGMQSRSDRCPPRSRLSLRFRDLPTKAVDVVLYAGRAADPV